MADSKHKQQIKKFARQGAWVDFLRYLETEYNQRQPKRWEENLFHRVYENTHSD